MAQLCRQRQLLDSVQNVAIGLSLLLITYGLAMPIKLSCMNMAYYISEIIGNSNIYKNFTIMDRKI